MYNQIEDTLHTVKCQHVVKFKIAVLCPQTKQSKIRNTDWWTIQVKGWHCSAQYHFNIV